ncbi:hypothetical protein PV409_36545 [Streptomyces sp. ME02-6979.5a]|uniref:hypothetical protein n=1 Tax=Streptomyces sp. ME02-6979.5a TaxID=462925 RepID=UPI0029BB96F9|nr:hypothetical protein [Streptomyces sp. ME02-6979.5a]MDX3343472.1 hypothetical protein [Streptomyces sp. ME02-6979.5a]
MSNQQAWRSSQSFRRARAGLPHNGLVADLDNAVISGSIIVLEREPWRVLEIKEKPEDLWPAQYEEAWQRTFTEWVEYEAGRATGELDSWGLPRKERPEPIRAEWSYRPINLVIQPVDSPKAKPRHIVVPVSYDWQTLPEHFTICRLCKELPPCRHVEMERTISAEVDKADRLMAIPRGACLGCGETITSRMKATRFPGPNLWRPDWGTDSAVFHARRQVECSNGVWRYEKQWREQGLNVLNPTLPDGNESEPNEGDQVT